MKAEQHIDSDFNQRSIKVAQDDRQLEAPDSEGLMNLCIAIIAQAAADYKAYKLMLSKETDKGLRRDFQKQIDKLEDFFWSSWFDLLSPAPREKVLAALDRAVEYAIKNDTLRKPPFRS